MKHTERVDLISKIGRHLQSTMTTTDINTYFSTFRIQTPNISMADNKWLYVKEILGTIDENIIVNIAKDLELFNSFETVSSAAHLLRQFDKTSMKVCQDDFEKAVQDVETNPANAIGMASTALESICKAMLDAFKEPYPKDESLQPLLKTVFKILDLSPAGHADPDLKRILGGLSNAGAGLAVLRTKYSTFHGKGANQLRLEKRHARLAVNSLTTVGMFLLETYFEMYKKDENITNDEFELPPPPELFPSGWEDFYPDD
ncbi:MAG: abortive infection family protein [Chloroflexi bacterium]|nr:abortive infection family protein [Chloroflexota bacterium]